VYRLTPVGSDAYRGTVALNVTVPGRAASRQIVLTSLDMWRDHVALNIAATDDRADPFWMPSAWRIATDAGTSHARRGGGGGSLHWQWSFQPALPADLGELRFHIGADGSRPPVPGSVPAEPSVTVRLPAWPPNVRLAPASFDAATEPARAGGGPTFELEPLRPRRVIPVSATLDHGADRDLQVLSIDAHPTWFLLRIGGSGPLAFGADDSPDGRDMARLRLRWAARDDRGGRYEGMFKSGHSGTVWNLDATFTPALDRAATALALEMPNPFGPGTVRTTVDLPPIAE